MSDLCPHGDIIAACIDCLEGPPPERPAPKLVWERTTTVIAAQHPSTCEDCGDPISPGDVIRLWQLWSDGQLVRNAWLHAAWVRGGCAP